MRKLRPCMYNSYVAFLCEDSPVLIHVSGTRSFFNGVSAIFFDSFGGFATWASAIDNKGTTTDSVMAESNKSLEELTKDIFSRKIEEPVVLEVMIMYLEANNKVSPMMLSIRCDNSLVPHISKTIRAMDKSIYQTKELSVYELSISTILL